MERAARTWSGCDGHAEVTTRRIPITEWYEFLF